MPRSNQVSELADHVALVLSGVPQERRAEAAVHILADYKAALAAQFPGSDEAKRRRFLTLFFALLQKRMGELAMTGGTTGGTA